MHKRRHRSSLSDYKGYLLSNVETGTSRGAQVSSPVHSFAPYKNKNQEQQFEMFDGGSRPPLKNTRGQKLCLVRDEQIIGSRLDLMPPEELANFQSTRSHQYTLSSSEESSRPASKPQK